MGKAPSSLLVSVGDRVAHIKVTGRANFASSVNFKMLVNELQERGYERFVLELADCVTMDSTFLGVLAGFALKLKENHEASDENVCLQLENPNSRVIDLLENLGVSHLFDSLCADQPRETAFEPSAQSDVRPTREEISQTCLEAHKTLMQVNPENIPKFTEVAQFLAEDLKKLKS